MRQLSFFRMPLLWLFLGPPAIREQGTRGALASIEEGQDIWNYIRFAWWLFWGTVAVIELARSHHLFQGFLQRLKSFPIWVMLWLTAIFASTIVSPAPTYTFANAAMLTLLVAAALDFALKIHAGRISARRVFRLLFILSLALLLLVYVLLLTYPTSNVAQEAYFGTRVRGGTVAYVPLVSLITIFSGVYFAVTSRQMSVRVLAAAAIPFGLYMLSLGQTRSAYLGFMLAAGLFVWHRWDLKRNPLLLAATSAVVVVGFSLILLSYDYSHAIRWRLDDYYEQYVLRDKYAVEDQQFAQENLGSLNGRTDVARILAQHAFLQPFGLGFIAGPRTLLLSDEVVEELQTASLGGAHNAYIEVWAGSGILGFIGWMGVIVFVVLSARRLRAESTLLLRVLLPSLLLEGMFESDLVVPFVQSSVLFWILAAVAIGLASRPATRASRRRASVEGRPPTSRRRAWALR